MVAVPVVLRVVSVPLTVHSMPSKWAELKEWGPSIHYSINALTRQPVCEQQYDPQRAGVKRMALQAAACAAND
eukprot:1159395-Pelagomonas_calceolata.AAC.3